MCLSKFKEGVSVLFFRLYTVSLLPPKNLYLFMAVFTITAPQANALETDLGV